MYVIFILDVGLCLLTGLSLIQKHIHYRSVWSGSLGASWRPVGSLSPLYPALWRKISPGSHWGSTRSSWVTTGHCAVDPGADCRKQHCHGVVTLWNAQGSLGSWVLSTVGCCLSLVCLPRFPGPSLLLLRFLQRSHAAVELVDILAVGGGAVDLSLQLSVHACLPPACHFPPAWAQPRPVSRPLFQWLT